MCRAGFLAVEGKKCHTQAHLAQYSEPYSGRVEAQGSGCMYTGPIQTYLSSAPLPLHWGTERIGPWGL